ncbi:MAG TPA: polyprenol monophosphomannose synthase [Anaerolineales bacterium]
MQLTVVIPTYNEAENLPKLVSALFALPIPSLKLLVVDDNSPDGTGEIAEAFHSEHPGQIDVLHRSGKLGLGTAYICGFQQALEAGAEAVAQMDADFSHPPEKMVAMLDALQTCDVAMGSRYVPGGSVDQRWPLWRKNLSAFGNLYAKLILGLPIHDATGGFRIWRRDTLLGMPLHRVRSNGYAFQVEMAYLATRLGFTFQEVPFYFADRRWGCSKMSWKIQVEAAIRVWEMRIEHRHLQRPQPD